MQNSKNQARALLEVLGVVVLYVVAIRLAIAHFDLSKALPAALGENERRVGAVFVTGAVVQLVFVLAAALFARRMREAIAATARPATRQGWMTALIAAMLQCAAIGFFFLPHPEKIFELSLRNASLSFVPAFDGWTQEVMFRGYLILRLAEASVPKPFVAIASGLAFASIHVGYFGESLQTAFWPFFGTFMFGAILALSVFAAKGSLKPAVFAHVLVILIIQPWLALAQ